MKLLTNQNYLSVLKLFNAEEPSDFLQDFAREKDDPTFADATLICQGVELPYHQFVLGAKSEVFKKMFSQDFEEGYCSIQSYPALRPLHSLNFC